MAFQNMIQEILGVAGMNRGLAATRLNEAFQKIQNENVWSFQCVTRIALCCIYPIGSPVNSGPGY